RWVSRGIVSERRAFQQGSRRAAQLVEQCPGLLQVGGVETLGEPVVDAAERRARFVAATGAAQQAREASGCAQLPRFGTHADGESYRLEVVGLGQLRIPEGKTQFAA